MSNERPHNAKAVELFKKHLPAKLAELCIEQHLASSQGAGSYLRHDPDCLKEAVYRSINWDATDVPRELFENLARSVTFNFIGIDFFEKYPEFAEPADTTEAPIEGKWARLVSPCPDNGKYWISENWYELVARHVINERPLISFKNDGLVYCTEAEAFDLENMLEYNPQAIEGNEDKGVTGDEPFHLPDAELEAHRAAELSAASNAEDTRAPMTEKRELSTEFVEQMLNDILLELKAGITCLNHRGLHVVEELEKVKARVQANHKSESICWDKMFNRIENATNAMEVFNTKFDGLERATHAKLDQIEKKVNTPLSRIVAFSFLVLQVGLWAAFIIIAIAYINQ